jgi:hypothetical protein
VEKALKNLLANNFDPKFVENSDAAKKIVLSSTSDDAVMGVGDSVIVREIVIVEVLWSIDFLSPFSDDLSEPIVDAV